MEFTYNKKYPELVNAGIEEDSVNNLQDYEIREITSVDYVKENDTVNEIYSQEHVENASDLRQINISNHHQKPSEEDSEENVKFKMEDLLFTNNNGMDDDSLDMCEFGEERREVQENDINFGEVITHTMIEEFHKMHPHEMSIRLCDSVNTLAINEKMRPENNQIMQHTLPNWAGKYIFYFHKTKMN